MNSVHQGQVQRKGQPCSLCGRHSETGKTIDVFGFVGPTCHSKLAALTQTLEREGLGEFMDGPVQFRPEYDPDPNIVSQYVMPMRIEALADRAERLGFRFEWSWPRTDGPATCWISLPQGRTLRKRLLGKLERSQEVTAA